MSLPIGTILVYSLKSLPPNYLFCDGESYENTIYNDLFNVINNTYGGSGDSFNVPNLKDKFPVGSNTLNEVGGCNTIKLKSKNMYEHNHNATITMQEHQHEINYTLSGSQVTSYSEKYLTNQAFTSTSLDYQTNERTYPAVHSEYYNETLNLSYNQKVASDVIENSFGSLENEIEIKNPRIKLNYIIKYKD